MDGLLGALLGDGGRVAPCRAAYVAAAGIAGDRMEGFRAWAWSGDRTRHAVRNCELKIAQRILRRVIATRRVRSGSRKIPQSSGAVAIGAPPKHPNATYRFSNRWCSRIDRF